MESPDSGCYRLRPIRGKPKLINLRLVPGWRVPEIQSCVPGDRGDHPPIGAQGEAVNSIGIGRDARRLCRLRGSRFGPRRHRRMRTAASRREYRPMRRSRHLRELEEPLFSPVPGSQSRMPSFDEEASCRPSGLNSTAWACIRWPLRTRRHFPVATSQIRTLSPKSELEEARVLPSGPKARRVTCREWP